MEPQIRFICPPGGIILFSGEQLHSTVPNVSGKTRFSIDFRTVYLDDVQAKRGAPNLDSSCMGTSLRDFLRAADFHRIPEEAAALYDDESSAEGVLGTIPRWRRGKWTGDRRTTQWTGDGRPRTGAGHRSSVTGHRS
jgi:hypothetical protein